ncbi:MAG TPA: hypoxanthine-guanine phosphoribosyltransferase [Solimonas sp.]|nr:hypoxanthine-guanine phosphoribosyltransferase [Solimonas sp.]
MGITQQEAEEIRAHAECLHDAAAVQAAYERMAGEIRADFGGRDPIMLCVMVGGFIPAAELCKRLEFPFEMDYLHATRYRGSTDGGGLIWKVHPSKPLAGRHVLVVDDILDEGHTLVEIRRALTEMQPASLKVAVLAEKIHERRAPGAHAEFIGLQVADRYVFGSGMDCKEYWRQLPGIWAMGIKK